MSPTISDSDRTLRMINLLLWVPSFALLVAYGAMSGQIVLPLGNIPMSLSALSTLIHLRPSTSTSHSKTKKGGLSLFSDFVLAIFLIALLIPSWILCDVVSRGSSKMLGAYATVPMMIAFSIHSYFVLRSIGSSQPKTCPHCNADLDLEQQSQRGGMRGALPSSSSSSGSSKESSYHEVADQETVVGLEREDYREPRASTDDENERLISTTADDE